MKIYKQSPPRLKPETPLKIQTISIPETQTPKAIMSPISPIIIKTEINNAKDKSEKFSMDKMCSIFLQRYRNESQCQFDAKEMAAVCNAKQRRIYDLMNILEGCGYVRRISKGRYEWLGFYYQEPEETGSQSRKNKDFTSLSNLAETIKLMIQASKTIISIPSIEKEILDKNKDTKLLPESIRRRIYQCCSVLRKIGFIKKQKYKNGYKWVPPEKRVPFQSEIESEAEKEQNCKHQKSRRINRKLLFSQEEEWIEKLVKNLKSKVELNGLFERMTNEFEKRQKLREQLYQSSLQDEMKEE